MKIQAYTSNYYNTYNNKNKKNTAIKSAKDNVSFGNAQVAKKLGLIGKGYDYLTSGIAYTLGAFASTKPAQKLVDFLKDKNYQRHLAAFVGVTLSSFYMLDTAKSKKIKKEDKLPLIVNQGVVCALSTAGGYTLDNYLDKHLIPFTEKFHISAISNQKTRKAMAMLYENPDLRLSASKSKKLGELVKQLESQFQVPKGLEKKFAKEIKEGKLSESVKALLDGIKKNADEYLKEAGEAGKNLDKALIKENKVKDLFLKAMKDSPKLKKIYDKQFFNNAIEHIAKNDQNLSTMKNGFKTAKSLIIFAMIYRFIAPVVATPFANSISAKYENYKKQKAAKVA